MKKVKALALSARVIAAVVMGSLAAAPAMAIGPWYLVSCTKSGINYIGTYQNNGRVVQRSFPYQCPYSI